ncbi:MAG: hypothetical protein RSD67_03265 [Oscillospiraceae bacterium]
MTKFCKFCGTQYEEGEGCTCEKAKLAAQSSVMQAEWARQSAANVAYQKMVHMLNGVLMCLKAYFRFPIKTTQVAVQRGDINSAATFLVVKLIASGLLLFSILAKICEIISDGINISAKAIGAFQISDLINLPKIKAPLGIGLLYGILISAIAICLCVLLVLVLNKIAHSDATLKDSLIAYGINSPISTIFLLAAFLMSFISLSIGLFLFTIAIIADMVMVVVSTQSLAKSSDSFVFWISSICGIAAVVFLTTTIFTKVFMLSAIGNITVSMKGETSQFKNVLNMLPAELTNLETFIQYIANKIL